MSSAEEKNVTDDVETEKKMKKTDYDTILINHIGQFGPYQLKVLVIASVLIMFRSWSSSEYVFTTGRINTRCFIPGCDSNVTEFTPKWVWSAVPGVGGAPDGCQRYANISALPADGSCPAHLFNSSLLQPCDSYVYENTNTVVYDLDLACDEWRRTLIGTIRFSGLLTCLIITGIISDRWGRKSALAFNACNAAWLGVIRYWINNYTLLVIIEFLETTFSGAIYSAASIIAIEVMGPKYRARAAIYTNVFMSIGQITLAVIAMYIPNWRTLTLVLFTPQFISILFVFMMSESVRWSLSKGRFKQAENTLKKIAAANGKTIPPEAFDALRLNHEEQNRKQTEMSHLNNRWLVIDVIRNKSILLRCLVCSTCWFAKSFIYIGLALISTTISGNKYFNFSITALAEIPGFFIASYLLNRIGRKPVLVGGFWLCALCQAAYIFIDREKYILSLSAFLLGKTLIGGVVLTSVMYTTELYPTQQRHRLFAFSSFVGSFGGSMAPLTPAFAAASFQSMPYVLFGSSAVIAGSLILLLPETLNAKLPDTMYEAQNIGKEEKTAEPLLNKA